jgi:hypothetical protein
MISLKQIARSIVIGSATIAAIAPSVSAQSIPNGRYGNQFPAGDVMEIENSKNGQIVRYTELSEPKADVMPLSKYRFKVIKSGVIQHMNSKSYWCLIPIPMANKMSKDSRCTRNGWKRERG